MTTTNEQNCILRNPCEYAGDSDRCTFICPHFISLHGASGSGGRVSFANVPNDYKNVTVANSPVRSSQPAVYEKVDIYVKTFVRQFEGKEQIRSLYLLSQATGTGKTTTAAAIANEYLLRHYIGSIKRGLQPLQRPVYFLDLNEWQSTYNEFSRVNVPPSIGEPAAEKYYTQLKIAQEVPLLVVDDIGVRTSTEAFRADVHAIINYRVSNRMPTVYTSNVPIEELANVFDTRLADRVRDMTHVITFEGESNRGTRRKGRKNERRD